MHYFVKDWNGVDHLQADEYNTATIRKVVAQLVKKALRAKIPVARISVVDENRVLKHSVDIYNTLTIKETEAYQAKIEIEQEHKRKEKKNLS